MAPLYDAANVGVGDAAPRTVFDLTARLSAGFDYRINRHWIAGVRVSGRHALGLGAGAWDSFEGAVHVSWYWYPRWWYFDD